MRFVPSDGEFFIYFIYRISKAQTQFCARDECVLSTHGSTRRTNNKSNDDDLADDSPPHRLAVSRRS